MAFTVDPEVAGPLAERLAAAAALPPAAPGDVATRRRLVEARQLVTHGAIPDPGDVTTRDFTTKTEDGATLLLRWYAKDGAPAGPAVVYAHGGGMILSNVTLYDAPVKRYVSQSGVPFLSVEFRYAPEHPAPTPVTDCHAALAWLAAHAGELGVDPARIAVMGDSGGGGIAAGLAILARDRGEVPVAAQVLVYPMLDDRTTVPDPALAGLITWSYDDNLTGWGALLGDARGGPGVSPYAAAARLQDAGGLPRAYLDVGALDIFRDETITYARRLLAAGVSTELHVHPAVPHAFETLAPAAGVSRRALADRVRFLQTL